MYPEYMRKNHLEAMCFLLSAIMSTTDTEAEHHCLVIRVMGALGTLGRTPDGTTIGNVIILKLFRT